MIRVLPKTVHLPPRTSAPSVRPIFVFGCPRSGTTLLGECIGAHPSACSVGESLFFRYLWCIFTDLAIQIDADGKGKPLQPFLDPSHRQPLIDSTGAYADTLLATLAGGDAGKLVVDHTPWNAAMVPLLVALYPQAHLVHIVRDARAVSQSLRKSFEYGRSWANDDPLYHARLWASLVGRAKLDAQALAPDRYHEIRYEDLCRSPVESLAVVLRGCGLSADERCLHPLAIPHAHSAEKTVLAAPDGGGGVAIRPIETVVEWPAEWSDDVVARFESTTGALMAELGYALG